MTLPASFPLSMSQVATELGISLPLSLEDSRVLALAGKTGAPISFSDLLGKTGRFDGSVLCQGDSSPGYFINLASAPFFGGGLAELAVNEAGGGLTFLSIGGSATWTGNILVQNNTTGASVALPNAGGGDWQIAGITTNLMRPTFTDSFTILPST